MPSSAPPLLTSAKGRGCSCGRTESTSASGAKVLSFANVLTSGQFDTDESVILLHAEILKKIDSPTVWTREEYGGLENKWVHT